MNEDKDELKLLLKKKSTLNIPLYNPNDYYLSIQGEEEVVKSFSE